MLPESVLPAQALLGERPVWPFTTATFLVLGQDRPATATQARKDPVTSISAVQSMVLWP